MFLLQYHGNQGWKYGIDLLLGGEVGGGGEVGEDMG